MQRILSSIKLFIKETDKLLLSLCLIASAFGLTMVHSATLSKISDEQMFSRDFIAMLIAVIIGIFLALIISLIDYELIIKLWPVIAIFSIGLMFVTYIWGVGPAARPDATTWLKIGNTGFYFQASELVKIGFIITFGIHLDMIKDHINKLKNILFVCLHAAIPIGLVAITGDAGSALVFIIIFACMLFMSGIAFRFIIAGIAIVSVSIPLVWAYLLKDLQKQRFLALIYPELYEDVIYQQERGLYAIGSGKLFGSGLFKGPYTQAGIVPENQNDMIFTVVGEELGFIGAFFVLILFALIIIKILHIGKNSKDNASANMCYGVASMIAGQVIINIGMCLMLLPVVGITLPFFSAGGSSNLCIYIGIGLVLSIFRHNQARDAISFRLDRIRTPFSE